MWDIHPLPALVNYAASSWKVPAQGPTAASSLPSDLQGRAHDAVDPALGQFRLQHRHLTLLPTADCAAQLRQLLDQLGMARLHRCGGRVVGARIDAREANGGDVSSFDARQALIAGLKSCV